MSYPEYGANVAGHRIPYHAVCCMERPGRLRRVVNVCVFPFVLDATSCRLSIKTRNTAIGSDQRRRREQGPTEARGGLLAFLPTSLRPATQMSRPPERLQVGDGRNHD